MLVMRMQVADTRDQIAKEMALDGVCLIICNMGSTRKRFKNFSTNFFVRHTNFIRKNHLKCTCFIRSSNLAPFI